ncbi:MAG: cell division protein ZapA [Pseudomonadota bacterium]
MAEVKVEIGGREFEVACRDGEEHFLRSAAQMLDNEASALKEALGRMPETRMLLMAGLMLADKTASLEDKLREGGTVPVDEGGFKKRAKKAEKAASEAQSQLAELKAQLAEAQAAAEAAKAASEKAQEAQKMAEDQNAGDTDAKMKALEDELAEAKKSAAAAKDAEALAAGQRDQAVAAVTRMVERLEAATS